MVAAVGVVEDAVEDEVQDAEAVAVVAPTARARM